MTLTTSAMLAKRYSPSGIIPTSDAIMDTTLSCMVEPMTKCCCKNSRIPIGIMAMPIIRTRRSKERIISVCVFLRDAFASNISCAAKDDSPTFVSVAYPFPETTKLPEYSISPGFFTTSSASPVISASLTRRLPFSTTASAQIWFPA